MTQYSDFTLEEGLLTELKKNYVRPWIEAQVAAGTQPTEAQVQAQYSAITSAQIEEWKIQAYSALVVNEITF